jgi:uncharacterized membrane protein
MVIVLLLIALGISLPLASQRNEVKRIVLIAIVLEALKIAFVLLTRGCDNEAFCLLLVLFYFTAMLPEMLVGGEHVPGSFWGWTAMFGAGVIWNLIPAYLITLFLPERNPRKT